MACKPDELPPRRFAKVMNRRARSPSGLPPRGFAKAGDEGFAKAKAGDEGRGHHPEAQNIQPGVRVRSVCGKNTCDASTTPARLTSKHGAKLSAEEEAPQPPVGGRGT